MSSRSTGDPAELIRAAQRGDTRALELLAREHYPFVLKVSVRLARSIGLHLDGEDLAQQAWARAIPALPGYRGHAKFTTWLHTVITTTAYNHVRQENRRMSRHERLRRERPTSDESIAVLTDSLAVQAALLQIPELEREVLLARSIQELTWADVVVRLEELGLFASEWDARMAHQRAAARLRQLLGHE